MVGVNFPALPCEISSLLIARKSCYQPKMTNEFRVNTYEEAWQDGPIVQSFADGSFLILWRSFNQEFDVYYIGAQLYDRFGNPVGGERVLDAEQGSASEISGITRLNDGGFVITFAYSFDGLLDQDQVYAKVYNADFSERTGRIKVDFVPDFESFNANVAALADGGFMVFYDSDEARPTQDDIYAQRYDRNGVAIGGNFLVNTNEKQFDQNAVSIAQLKNGNVLAMWHSEGSFPTPGDLDSNEIRGTIYGANGQVIRADFSIADAEGTVGDGIDPFSVTETNNGGFALVRYETESAGKDFTYDVKLRLYNKNGNKISDEITVTKETRGIVYSVDVAQLVSGEIVVVWQTPSVSDYPYDDVLAKVFDASGRPISGVFNVAQATELGQEDPDIEALPGGGFVVTYMSEAADADHDGIAARVFGRAGGQDDVAFVDETGVLAGLDGNDTLNGNDFSNSLFGGAGDDKLFGFGGRDYLNGGDGADQFFFDRAMKNPNKADVMSDFTRGVDDIVLNASFFSKLGPTVTKAEFRKGSAAADKNDFLVYKKSTGDLFYDPDGSGAKKALLIASLQDGAALGFSDFLLV
jgi:hypothetical protein